MEDRKELLEKKEALSKRLSLEVTTLLSLMITANESDYNHLDVACNAVMVAQDHLNMIEKDEPEEEYNHAKESGDIDNSREDEAREIRQRSY